MMNRYKFLNIAGHILICIFFSINLRVGFGGSLEMNWETVVVVVVPGERGWESIQEVKEAALLGWFHERGRRRRRSKLRQRPW